MIKHCLYFSCSKTHRQVGIGFVQAFEETNLILHFISHGQEVHIQQTRKEEGENRGKFNLRIRTAGEVTEDNENSLSSGWNFLDRFKLQDKFNIYAHIQ